MKEYRYKVCVPGDVVCENVRMDYAIMIAQALLDKYYADPNMSVTIVRINNTTEENNEERVRF